MRGHTTEQLTFGGGFIDPSLFALDEELTRVDKLLSEPSLLKPFEETFDETMGRPGTPVDVYLRMMYLKFRSRPLLRRGRTGGPGTAHLAQVLSPLAHGLSA